MWNGLLDRVAALPSDAAFRTMLSRCRFRVANVQAARIRVEYVDGDGPETLRRERFATLYGHLVAADDGFDLDRLPTAGEPYATVLSVHPDVALDDETWTLTTSETAVSSPMLEYPTEGGTSEVDEDGAELSVEELLDNMGEPRERTECPIDGCRYGDRSARSVAGHVSASSTAKHVWTNTDYAGWRDFVRRHGESPD